MGERFFTTFPHALIRKSKAHHQGLRFDASFTKCSQGLLPGPEKTNSLQCLIGDTSSNGCILHCHVSFQGCLVGKNDDEKNSLSFSNGPFSGDIRSFSGGTSTLLAITGQQFSVAKLISS